MISAVARRSGISPLEVLALPPDLYLALEADVRQGEWGVTQELLALQVELTHALIRTVRGLVSQQRIAPLKVPRPGEEPERLVVRPSEFARMMRGGERGH